MIEIEEAKDKIEKTLFKITYDSNQEIKWEFLENLKNIEKVAVLGILKLATKTFEEDLMDEFEPVSEEE